MPKKPKQKGSSSKEKTKGKLLVFPGRPTLGDLLKAVTADFEPEKPHEALVIIRPVGDLGVGIMSNIDGSPDKIWLLEHAKLLVLSGDME